MARFEHFKTKPWPLHVVTVTNFAYGSCFCFRDGQWSWDLMREWLLGNMCHCAYPLIQLQPQEMLQHPTALIRWLLLLTLYAGRLLAHHMEDTTTYNHWTHFTPSHIGMISSLAPTIPWLPRITCFFGTEEMVFVHVSCCELLFFKGDSWRGFSMTSLHRRT